MDIGVFRNPVLMFSAGKDSLALLHLLRKDWGRLTVLWSNPGAPTPEAVAYMAGIKALVPNFVEVTGNQPAWIEANGWPADVLPARATRIGEIGAGPAPVRFAPYWQCCAANMWSPMLAYVQEHGCDLVMTGQRQAEDLRNRLRDSERSMIDGITYWNPLHAWSSADVYAFLDEQGLDLPPFYEHGATSSADCWNCTAYLDHNTGRLAHMRQAEPERFAVVHRVLFQLHTQIERDRAPMLELV